MHDTEAQAQIEAPRWSVGSQPFFDADHVAHAVLLERLCPVAGAAAQVEHGRRFQRFDDEGCQAMGGVAMLGLPLGSIVAGTEHGHRPSIDPRSIVQRIDPSSMTSCDRSVAPSQCQKP